MQTGKILALILTAAASALAQPTPPPQPTDGPGGSSYTYASVQQFGPYYVFPQNPQPFQSYLIFEPTSSTPPKSLPVVLFLHGDFLGYQGYPEGDSPDNYTFWIDHLVRKGYTVVFPAYDHDLLPAEFTASIIEAWASALISLESGTPGLISPSVDAHGLRTVFAGHSMGAVQSFSVAQQLTLTPIAGVPLPRAIAGFQPGIGLSGLSTNFSQISPDIAVVLVCGDDDTSDIPTAESIWSSISTTIPASSRDFLEVISDYYGSPAQLGNHWYPDTNGFMDDDSGVDDRDFNVTWKLSTGLFDCVLALKYCSYGLGHGSTNQTSLGNWSDGRPVVPLSLQN